MWFDNINQAVTLWRARSPAHWVIIFHTVYGRPPRCLLQRNSPTQHFLFQIPPFSPWEEISFPFHFCKLSDDVMLTEFPLLQTILLTSALLLATTHSCSWEKRKKKNEKKGKGSRPLAPETGWMEMNSDNADLSPSLRSYLPTHGWDGGKERVGFEIFCRPSQVMCWR